MKRLNLFLLPFSLLVGHQANAGDTCDWSDGVPPLNVTRILPGIMHAPISAKPGDVLGTPSPREFTMSSPGSEFLCFNDGTVLWNFDMDASAPVFPDPLPPVDGVPSDGFILKTNVDGVGARVQLFAPFNGSAGGYFMPEGGARNPFVPFRSSMQENNEAGGFRLRGFHNQVTLVKIGDIAPGMHQVDTELFTGRFSPPGMGLVLHYRV